ncbi:MAG TPA: hypothetical protein VET48_14945, partial [Steroidobacteraceae bacterium]|nr:hypothetical protein [Steroidobacteraceae bacterium]
MTPERWRRVKEIFAHASALAVEAREKYLTSLELDDAELHAEIVSLLAAHETADAVVDLSAADYLPNELRDTSADSWIGRRIGAYKLIALLGRG